jgi:hypothetical protein
MMYAQVPTLTGGHIFGRLKRGQEQKSRSYTPFETCGTNQTVLGCSLVLYGHHQERAVDGVLNSSSFGAGSMRRREFITLFCATATAWPGLAAGQNSTKRPLIAWVSGGERTASWTFVEAFLQGMRDFGYIEGQHFDFTPRFADGYAERLPVLADEIVRLSPSAILAPGSGPAVAARKATAKIPIVAPALADAVHLGLIASEARPCS